MSKTLSLYCSSEHFDLDTVRSLPRTFIPTDWTGNTIQPSIEWVLARDTERLWFYAFLPWSPSHDDTLSRGAFVEGLWESDVVEFFLRDPQTGSYQEFNISPSGAWWSVYLTSYRKRAEISPRPSVYEVAAHRGEKGWEAYISLDIATLSVKFDSALEAHVSAISHSPTVRYFSSAPVPGIEADFHNVQCFALVHDSPFRA